MQRESSRPILSAVFVDYDNVYLSLKRKSEEAAKRFAKDASSWIKAVATGALITPTNTLGDDVDRRLVMNRCYGNPVPRRNSSDNSTDMNSFAFVRHHFLRSGFEIIDCPPLTAQLKNSSDIRMVMDVRDYLDHKTNFDEFIILSSDADFTPVLHRLRSHAKRTVIFANDNTVAPYTALSDGEVREADLIAHLLGQRIGSEPKEALAAPSNARELRDQIIDQVVQAVLEADEPQPLEALADRAIRGLGHDRTVGGNWAGAGSFRELLMAELPDSIKLTGEPPYLAYEAARQLSSRPAPAPVPRLETQPIPASQPAPAAVQPEPAPAAAAPGMDLRFAPQRQVNPVQPAQPAPTQPAPQQAAPAQPALTQPAPAMAPAPEQAAPAPAPTAAAPAPATAAEHAAPAPAPMPSAAPTAAPTAQPMAEQRQPAPPMAAGELQESISRIHEACKAPPYSPPEYRALFSIIAQEIGENQLQGVKTLENVSRRAEEIGIAVGQDEARYVLDAISEADPWFEQGASAPLFASRFRNFVVARCRDHGLSLSASELDLIDAWFAGSPKQDSAASAPFADAPAAAPAQPAPPQPAPAAQAPMAAPAPASAPAGGNDWWQAGGQQQPAAQPAPAAQPDHRMEATTDQEDFPRIVRNRLRG